MKDADFAFTGFTKDAAKKSSTINRVLTNIINSVERDIKFITSTPKGKGTRMEISFSKSYESAVKYEPNFCVTMDYDSGYISHNQESNSDCSLENLSETMTKSLPSKPIYLSEDALLEKPEVNVKFHDITTDTEKDDCEDYKHLLNSSDIVIPGSVVSERTTYSGFDNDNSDSDVSIEIPKVNQIIVETSNIGVLNCLNLDNDLHCDGKDCGVNISNEDVDNVQTENFMKAECINRLDIVGDKENNALHNDTTVKGKTEINTKFLSGEFHHIFPQSIFPEENGQCCTSLNNITNLNTENIPLRNNETKKKLTLVFTKENKENVYSVKRKYHSITPDKSATPEKLNKILEKSLTPEKIISPLKMVTSLQNYTECELLRKPVANEDQDLKKSMVSEKKLTPSEPSAIQEEIQDFEKCITVISEKNMDFEKSFPSSSQSISENSQCLGNSVTPEKKYENHVDPNISPDLFLEEETLQKAMKEVMQPSNFTAEEKYIIKKDHRILKRAQNSLKGVLPPLSVTVVQLSIDEILNRLESNKDYFWTNSCPVTTTDNNEKHVNNLNSSNESNVKEEPRSLLVTGTYSDCVKDKWPDVLEERYHGLHYNRSKLSEEFEDACAKYGQRYVGAETLSSCTVFETNFVSPTKRKQLKQRWAVKSPGRRLSHLARRRITFSSASLQAGASSVAGSRARQILVDAKKLNLLNRRKSPRKSPRKTPKKTPSKSPRLKSRTPSSSAKKKLAMRFRELSGEIEKTVPSASNNLAMSSKRAVFLSPDGDKKSSLFLPSTSGLSFKSDLKKPNTKRALFMSPSKKSPLKKSPFKRSPFKRLDLCVDKKRKRSESGGSPPSKLIRIKELQPSECETATKCNKARTEMNISLNRSQSSQSGELSAIHKKKLQWAVYEALRSQNITPTHAQFKIFASILARVTRRFLPNLTGNAPRPEGGTSERMLRIARHHVYAVVKGKSVDEIISEYLKNRPKNIKPQGYVGIEEYEKRTEMVTNKENIMRSRGNTLESLERKKLEPLSKPMVKNESRIDRIRKVINFGDDNR